MSEWISVKDRLPDKENLFLIIYGESRDITLGLWNLKNKRFEEFEIEWFGYEIPDVTHWMPLPELPKESDTNA